MKVSRRETNCFLPLKSPNIVWCLSLCHQAKHGCTSFWNQPEYNKYKSFNLRCSLEGKACPFPRHIDKRLFNRAEQTGTWGGLRRVKGSCWRKSSSGLRGGWIGWETHARRGVPAWNVECAFSGWLHEMPRAKPTCCTATGSKREKLN